MRGQQGQHRGGPGGGHLRGWKEVNVLPLPFAGREDERMRGDLQKGTGTSGRCDVMWVAFGDHPQVWAWYRK